MKYIAFSTFDYCLAREHRCNLSCLLSIHSKLGFKHWEYKYTTFALVVISNCFEAKPSIMYFRVEEIKLGGERLLFKFVPMRCFYRIKLVESISPYMKLIRWYY